MTANRQCLRRSAAALILASLFVAPILGVGQTKPAPGSTPDAAERARRILENQPHFQAGIQIDAPREHFRTSSPSWMARRARAYRFEFENRGSPGYSVVLFQADGDTVNVLPEIRQYLVAHDFSAQVIAATWRFADDLLRNPKWALAVTGEAEINGHPCTRIRATFEGSSADDVTLYAANDLRGLVVRVESPRPSHHPCDRPMPQSYHLTDIRLGAPSSLFRRPRGYKPVEIYDPPPLCQGVIPDNADVTVGEEVRLRAVADDPGDGRIRYSWTSSGGKLTISCAEAILSTDGMAPGDYTVTVQIGDGWGHTVECSTSVRVRDRTAPEPARKQDGSTPSLKRSPHRR